MRRRYGGWSNDKPLAGARRFAGSVADDPFAVGAALIATAGGLTAAIVLPHPGRVAVPLATLVTIGAGWRMRVGNRRVSYLVDRDQWERRHQDVTAACDVEVDVGRLAKAVDPDGTIRDVLVTCRLRDAAAVSLALGMEPEPYRAPDQSTGGADTPIRT